MAAQVNRLRFISRRLPARTLGMCALLALAAFACSRSIAQSAPPRQTPPAQPETQQATPAAVQPATDAQSSSAASASPAPAQKDATAPPAQQASSPAPTTGAVADQARPPYPGMTPEEKRKAEVAQECADLLKLATDLKAQVDKARKDELSVTVVRKAYELEQMAHKVRSGSALSASNQ